MQPVVVFDPHPDDADWWTGGLTCLLVQKGIDVHYVCAGLTTDETRAHAEKSAQILGVKRHFLEISFTQSDFTSVLREKVEGLMGGICPGMIFIPSLTDYHHEHVELSRELLHIFYHCRAPWFEGVEVYAFDSHENRDLVEIYIDVSDVWPTHIRSLECHKVFERATIPENTLARIKTGRAMVLGASVPVADPVCFAEGYRIIRGHPRRITTLRELFPEKFYFQTPLWKISM